MRARGSPDVGVEESDAIEASYCDLALAADGLLEPAGEHR
jgi:hypothetical protein